MPDYSIRSHVCRIFDRYILKETLVPFFSGLFIFTFVLLMDNLFQLIDYLIGKKVGGYLVWQVFVYTLPFIFSLTIPMAVLVSMISAFGRLSGDSEIIAIRSFGINPLTLLKYPLILSLLLFAGLSLFNGFVVPESNYRLKTALVKIARKRPSLNLQERVFNTIHDGYTLWAERIDHSKGLLTGVQLKESLRGEPDRIIEAHQASMFMADDTLILHFYDGEVHEIDRREPSRYRVLSFSEYITKIPFPSERKGGKISRSRREMNLVELFKRVKRQKKKKMVWRYLLEIQKKFSIPLAGVLFVLVGAPIGIGMRRGGIGTGVTMSFFIFLFYYIIMIGGEELSERGMVSPYISVWLPNIFLIIIGAVAIRKGIYGR